MRVAIRHFGSSRGILIPKPTLPSRDGWADTAEAMALTNNDELLLGELSKKCDEDLAR